MKKKLLGHIISFFLTLKLNSQETAQNFEKGILPVHSLLHEELYRSITYFMNQELKFLRYVMQPEIRITSLSLSGISLQCGGVQDP